MGIDERVEQWRKDNEYLIVNGNTPISFDVWEQIRRKAVLDHIKKEQEHKENVKKHIKNDSEIANLIRSFGGFYFNSYKNLLKLNIPRQYMFRYTYLCTFMNYDNKIEWGNAKEENALALEKDLQEILNLSQNETIRTKKDLIKFDLMKIMDDKTILINRKYATKGEINKKVLKGSVRAMEKGLQELYNKSKPTEHKKLALLIELLPYLNFRHNVLCHNPEEKSVEKIDPMLLGEVAKMFKTNQTRLKRDLFDITVNGELTIAITETKYGKFIYVNPRVYYKGDDIESLKALINVFRVGAKKNG